MADKKLKPPTPQAISALLKRAGFERSRPGSRGRVNWDGTTVRGSRPRIPGFEVRADVNGAAVSFNSGRVVGGDATAELRIRMLRRYAEEIDAAGYAALVKFDHAKSHVLVSAVSAGGKGQ